MPPSLLRPAALALLLAGALAAGPAGAQSPAPAAPAPAAPAANTAPGFIVALVGRASGAARDAGLSPAARRARFQALVRQDFDLPGIARFVMGSHWRAASEDQRAQFTEAFADYMVALYAPQMEAYGGRPFTVTGQRAESDVTVVSTRVAQSDGQPPVGVDWRTVKGADGYRVTDVVVEGVSLAQTKRDEISAVLARSGGEVGGMIAQIRDRTGQAAAGR